MVTNPVPEPNIEIISRVVKYRVDVPLEAKLVFYFTHNDYSHSKSLEDPVLVITRERSNGEPQSYIFTVKDHDYPAKTTVSLPLGFVAYVESLMEDSNTEDDDPDEEGVTPPDD